MDGIEKIKDEDNLAWRNVARLKARVAELEKEVVDSQVACEKERKEKNTSIDRMVQLLLLQTAPSAPPQNSNSVKSKRSSPPSAISSQKRIKIDLTSSDTEHGQATVQGLVLDAADTSKFTLIAQSELPQVTQQKVKAWIQKLDAYPVKPGTSPWLTVGNKTMTTCAVRRLHKGSSTWADNNRDRACMECSKKGNPCIVIRTTGPILLPSHRLQDLLSSDPEYWIKSTQ